MQKVKLRVWGDFACFTRPEMKAERVSYDAMTPSAARGALEAVYWKPQIRWIVERIHVINAIRFGNLRRNEVGSKISGPTKAQLEGRSGDPMGLNIEEDRQQRATTLLTEVDYLIEARFEVLDPNEHPAKHYEMFKRRVEKGQCFQQPYLGCREFVANFAWHEGAAPESHYAQEGEKDLGWMLLDLDYTSGMEAQFFRASMKHGVIEVPAMKSKEVRS